MAQVQVETTAHTVKVVRISDNRPLIEVGRGDLPKLALIEQALRREGKTDAANRIAELSAAHQ